MLHVLPGGSSGSSWLQSIVSGMATSDRLLPSGCTAFHVDLPGAGLQQSRNQPAAVAEHSIFLSRARAGAHTNMGCLPGSLEVDGAVWQAMIS